MAGLSPREQLELALARPELVQAVDALMKRFYERTGKVLSVVPDDGGVRSTKQQAQIYADSLKEGFRAAPPGGSMHEMGAAADLHVVGETSGDAVTDQKSAFYRIMGDEAVKLGLRAGFYYKSGLPDPYHVELNETITQAQEKWKALSAKRAATIKQVGRTTVPVAVALSALVLVVLMLRRMQG